ncbi:hypothetical protein M8J77_005847 [Diaphorina citri]|nr:hypothetical protein M8J77_005847 [Diaphorina citri]
MTIASLVSLVGNASAFGTRTGTLQESDVTRKLFAIILEASHPCNHHNHAMKGTEGFNMPNIYEELMANSLHEQNIPNHGMHELN